MSDSDVLSEDIQDALEELCDQGNEAMDEGDPEEALIFFQRAVDLLPPPAEEWEPWGWLQAAIGDAHYAMGKPDKALYFFLKAYTFADPEEATPYLLLRLGQTYRRTGDMEKAREFLLRAYQLEGKDLFNEDQEDYAFLRENVPLEV